MGRYRLGRCGLRWRIVARRIAGCGIGHHRHQGLARVGGIARRPIATGAAVTSVAVAAAAFTRVAVLGALALASRVFAGCGVVVLCARFCLGGVLCQQCLWICALAIRRCITVLAARATARAASVAPALAAVFIACAAAFFSLGALVFAACILRVAAGQPSVLACFSAGPVAWATAAAFATWCAFAAFPRRAVALAAVVALSLGPVAVGLRALAVGRATGVARPASTAAAAAIALSVALAGVSGALACAVVLAWSALRAVFAVGVAAFGYRRRCSGCRGGRIAAK